MAKILLNVDVNKGTSKQTLEQLRQEVDKVFSSQPKSNSINNLQKQYASLLTTIKNVEKYYAKGTFAKQKQEVEGYLAKIRELNSLMQKGNALNATEQQRLAQLKTELKGASQAYDNLSTEVKTAQATNKNYHGSLLEIIQGFAKFNLAATVVMKTINLLRSAWNSVNETLVKTEDAVIALQRVAGQAANADELYDLAQRYGQTFENVNEIALNFARSGMDWADTIKATESALLALNVAELDATQASDGMIAIMTQFGIKAENLTEVVDKLNITADNAAVSTDKLLTALQRTGSSAVNANLSLEETVGLITALSEATGRSGENLGTAVNSLIQFSTKASSLDVFESLGGSVAEKVEAYRHGSADVLDIWRELSNVVKDVDAENTAITDLFEDGDWQSLNQELQDALGENFATVNEIYGTASTFRKNYFIALLNNLDQVDETLQTMNEANGYSQKENEQYLDTYTAKVNALQAKWQDIANDEQGLLGIKKDLVDMASDLLTIVDGIGGLKTALIAVSVVVGTILMQVKGAQIVSGLKLVITTLKSLTIDALPNAIGAWKAYKAGIVSANTAIQASLPLITAIIIALSAIDNAIRENAEAREEAEKKAREEQDASIAKANENATAYKSQAQALSEYADKVKELREIVDSTTDGEQENTDAKNQLLEIQDALIESNNSYADSLDLVNGNLADQLGLIEQLSSEQLKQKAQDFLASEEANISIANDRINSTSTTNTDMLFSGNGIDRHDFRDIINSAISGAGVGENASLYEDNTYGFYHNYAKRVGEGFSNSFWDGVGELLGFGTVFDKASYVGEANAGFSFSGTVEEQLTAIQALKDYIAKNRESLGLSAEESVAITTELQKKYDELNSDDYKNATLLQERAKLAEDYINGKITEEEYLKEFYGIEKEINDGSLVNTLDDLNDTLKDKILTELEALRSTEEKSNALEEKRQALENAKNQRTVRVFNAETGSWEQVANQKDIQKAEEAYEEEAYKQIEELLKDENRSTEAMVQLLATIAGVMPEISDKVSGILADNGIELPAYDSGGVLSGLGGIKATTKDEIVLPPDIAEKILQPTSNEQFRNFTKSLGILFGASERVGTTTSNGIVYNNSRGGDTVNSNNSTQQYINGVQIPQNAQHYTIAELFEAMALTNNN